MKRLLLLLAAVAALQAHALTADEAKAIAIGESDARIEAIGKAVAKADDRTAAFLQALADDAVKTAGGKVFIVRDGKGTDPVTGAAADVPAEIAADAKPEASAVFTVMPNSGLVSTSLSSA